MGIDTSNKTQDQELTKKKFLNNSIGFETFGGKFTPILKQGLSIPCEEMVLFTKEEDNQTSMDINVFQGNGKFLSDPSFIAIGKFTLTGLPKVVEGKILIIVRFLVTQDGKFRIEANVNDSGQSIEVIKAGKESDNEEHIIDVTTQIMNKNDLPRFHPKRIFAICTVEGLYYAGIVGILAGIYGLLTGSRIVLDSFELLLKVAGIAFIVGFLVGLRKL